MFNTYILTDNSNTVAYIFCQIYIYIFVILFIYVILNMVIGLISEMYAAVRMMGKKVGINFRLPCLFVSFEFNSNGKRFIWESSTSS